MDERLIGLAKSSGLCLGGFGECEDYKWATAERVKWAIELLPILFEETRNRKASRSSYGLKHDVEHLFQKYAPELSAIHECYLSNGELILAMAYCGFHSYDRSGPNAFYLLKDKRKGKDNKRGVAKELADKTELKIKEWFLKKFNDLLVEPDVGELSAMLLGEE